MLRLNTSFLQKFLLLPNYALSPLKLFQESAFGKSAKKFTVYLSIYTQEGLHLFLAMSGLVEK